MTVQLIAVDLMIAVLVAGLWAGAAGAALRGRYRTALPLLGAAVLETAARVVIVLLLARAGWWFVQEKVLVGLPLVVVPGLVAVILTGPALVRQVCARAAASPAPLGRTARAGLVAAAGGGVAAVLATLVVGYPLTPFAVLGLVLLVVLPAAQQLSRGSVVQVTTALAVGAVLVALGGAWFGSIVPDRMNMAAHGAGTSAVEARSPHRRSRRPWRIFAVLRRIRMSRSGASSSPRSAPP